MIRHFTLLGLLGLGLLAAGCASVNLDQQLAQLDQDTQGIAKIKPALQATAAQRENAANAAKALLAKPLSRDDALQLAMLNSPDIQAQLAQSWANANMAAQTGRIHNPVFSFERLASIPEIEFTRMLTVGLLDLLTLPQRNRNANAAIQQQSLQSASEMVERLSMVRQAWIAAVAAGQSLKHAQQVHLAADASADLARRMQQVGNFNRLQRARQQAFYADSVGQLATAKQMVVSTRETLVRALGLDDIQASQLKLPERLPDLPAQARAPELVSQAASKNRLDTRLSAAMLKTALRSQGLERITSLTDIELKGIQQTTVERADGHRNRAKGFEVELRLPIFDFGGLKRDAANAQTLAAMNRHEATLRAAGSHLRESYSAYRTALDLAKHYRDEVVPLRKLINDENVLRYNGMLIGVFELLADTRDQIQSVIAAINAQQQFWMADAALEATILGKPMSASVSKQSAAPTSSGAAH